jgi:hypothetical protein
MQPIWVWKKFVFAASLLFAFAAASNEQPEKPKDDAYWTSLVESTTVGPATRPPLSNRLTIAPLSLLMGALAAELDTALGDRVSWQIGGSAVLFLGPLRVQPTPAAELATGLRFFPLANDRASAGFWLGIGVFSWVPSNSSSFSAGMNATIGYTFVARAAGFTTSIGAGARAMTGSGFPLRVTPVLHLNVGTTSLESTARTRQSP